MRAIEAQAVAQGATYEGLMERAGQEIARLAINRLGAETNERVLVLSGPGNNGGDALVAARYLRQHGWEVRCYTWSRASAKDARLRDPLKLLRVEITALEAGNYRQTLEDALHWSTVGLDGLLGTGLVRDVEGELAGIIEAAARSGKRIIAVDIPSGIDSDRGRVRGVALPADFTVALGYLKYGHVLEPGKRLSGEIAIGDIGLSTTSNKTASGELLTDESVREMLPERPDDANKGTFGKAMIVAGSVNYIGAAALATEGAMRSGAGLVTLACAGDLLPILASRLTESTFVLLPSDMGVIASHAAEKVHSAVEGYSALLVGCGISKERETASFLRALLGTAEAAVRPVAEPIGFASRVHESATKEAEKAQVGLPPLVLDGDALNILAENEEWFSIVPQGSILTPHPGEMARLLGSTVEDVQSDRVRVAADAAAKWKQIVALKGAATVIADPAGEIYISPFSNPALATAGTGDVLAGVIAGLLAQGLAPVKAACAGVYLHGMAGDLLRDEYGPSGGLAGDLPVLIARAQHKLRDSSGKGA